MTPHDHEACPDGTGFASAKTTADKQGFVVLENEPLLSSSETTAMLINHDFAWVDELDVGRAFPPDVSGAALAASAQPAHDVVIIDRRTGFSRSTLILALVALVLSAVLRFFK